MQLDDVPLVRGLEHRGGTFHSRTMAEGRPARRAISSSRSARLGTDYSGPRHRHNFDQYRFMIEGSSDYGQDGPLKAGMLGYYPEGVPYGPQVNKTEIFCAVLQFGGASGSGYLLPREVKAGMEEMKKFGEFKDGIFHRHDGVAGKPQHGRLSGDLGARARARDGLSEGPLPRADLARMRRTTMGAGTAARRAFPKSCSGCGPSAARKPGLHPDSRRARATRSADAASIWCCRARASARAIRSSSTRRSTSNTANARHCGRARQPSFCITGCPISRTCKPRPITSGAMQAAE